MTVWDSMALNAPHTLRELAQDGEPDPGSTTEPENATCPSAGGFGGVVVLKPLAWVYDPDNSGDVNFYRAYADPYVYEVGADRSWWWAEDEVLPFQHGHGFKTRDEAKAAAQADYEARILPALERIVTPQAILTAIAAEKAEWPHAGVMHAAARTACDNIAARIKKLMGVA